MCLHQTALFNPPCINRSIPPHFGIPFVHLVCTPAQLFPARFPLLLSIFLVSLKHPKSHSCCQLIPMQILVCHCSPDSWTTSWLLADIFFRSLNSLASQHMKCIFLMLSHADYNMGNDFSYNDSLLTVVISKSLPMLSSTTTIFTEQSSVNVLWLMNN